MKVPLALALAFGCVQIISEPTASASPPACIAVHAAAQGARRDGHLLSARDQFLACTADETCPAMIRRDCADLLEALVPAIPSVVFVGVDRAGKDTAHVQVSRDGQLLLKELDLRALEMDPGSYTFHFLGPEGETKDESVLLREGDKERHVSVDFSAPTPVATVAAEAHPRDARNWVLGLSALGVAAAGAGLGTYFGLEAKADNDNSQSYCNASNQCHSQGVTLRNAAFTDALVADVAFGGALLAAGAGVFLLVADPFGPHPTASGANTVGRVSLAPLLAPGRMGLGAELRW